MKPLLAIPEARKITGLDFECFKTSFGPSVLIDYCQRPFVCVKDSKNHILPFWMSTGRGKKKNVSKGRWYPVVGMSPRWINKYDQDAINSYYGSEKLRHIAHILDERLVCLHLDGSRNFGFEYEIPVLEMKFLCAFIDLMNTNSPHPCIDSSCDVTITVDTFLESIGEKKYFS